MTATSDISYRFLLHRAWPIILANAAVPFLGLVDTAVIGNFGSVSDLGAIAFGSLIFSFVYWSFGFLRMGTTGFAAQADGAGDHAEVRAVLGRSMVLALLLGIALIALQWPISQLAFLLLDGSEPVERVASAYFNIRIWGAPATLSGFVFMGLLIGLGKSRELLLLQVFLNGLNVLLDILFAGYLGLGARGIALGTVLSEWSTVLFGAWLLYRQLRGSVQHGERFWDWQRIIDARRIKETVQANTHIMIRTLLLVFSFAFFVNQSARYGDVLLAANHILLQIISFSAFFLDGYAFVVESLVGGAKGARNMARFDIAVRRSSLLALATAVVLAVLIVFAGSLVIAVLTDLQAVRVAAQDMLYFAASYVLLSCAAFQLDGVFIGVSRARQMRDAAALSLSVFLLCWWLLTEPMGIQGLWLAMNIYVVARAVALLLFYPGLRRSIDSGRV